MGALGAWASAGGCRDVIGVDDLVLGVGGQGGVGGAAGKGGASGGASSGAGGAGGGETVRQCQQRCAQGSSALQISKYYEPFAACGCFDGAVPSCQAECGSCEIRGETFGFASEACISCLGRKARSPDCPPNSGCNGPCAQFRDCIEGCGG